MKLSISILFVAYSTYSCFGQRVIAVQNPSFEKNQLWHSCIFTARHVAANVTSEDNHTNTSHNFVGQSERAFEGISQQLLYPIQKSACYQLTFYARRDSNYISLPGGQDENIPLNLFIYGENGNCGFGELIASPQVIHSHTWTKYVVTLQGQQDWTHLNLYAIRSDYKPYNGYVLFHQQGLIKPVFCPDQSQTDRPINYPELLTIQPFNILTFGGILMLYEVGPQSIKIFDRKAEIIPSDSQRKDESRNYRLDSVLNQYRGIDYLFLILKNKRYRHKKLNLISYLKTKYPEILEHSNIIRYSTLPSNLYRKEDQEGDVLIVEKINNNIKKGF